MWKKKKEVGRLGGGLDLCTMRGARIGLPETILGGTLKTAEIARMESVASGGGVCGRKCHARGQGILDRRLSKSQGGNRFSRKTMRGGVFRWGKGKGGAGEGAVHPVAL